MTGPEDDLERRLRAVLHSRRLNVAPDTDALERIHAGARRRQRRQRIATSGVAALAVVAVAVTGVVVRPGHHRAVTADGFKTPSLTATQTPSVAPSSTPSSAPSSGNAQVTASDKVAVPAATIPAGGAPPKGFVPMSVTAIDDNTYWVLGHAPCKNGTCTALAKTTDAGKTFTEVGAPPSALVPDNPGNKDVFGADTIADVRFVDSNDGWAYGGALWETTDGGQHWKAAYIPGAVQKLEVASGRAWAIAFTSATGGAVRYGIFSATYPGGTWQDVTSAGTFGPGEPMLAVQGKTVVAIGTDASTGKARGAISTDGSTHFGSLPPTPPCTGSPGAPLSPTARGLWLACSPATNATGGVYFSADFGSTWQVAASTLNASRVAIGAVDEKSAIVADGKTLKRVNADGSSVVVSVPKVSGTATWSFIGFTDPQVGFAVPIVNGTRQLWRTTDGGAHWSVVKF